jgi:hypothetical protein
MSTPDCQIIATRAHKRPIRVTGDPQAPYVNALKSMGWTVTVRPIDPWPTRDTDRQEATR